MINNINGLERRVGEIEKRHIEIAKEKPILAKEFDDAIASGDRAKALVCYAAIQSNLMELYELSKEVKEIQSILKMM